MRTYLQGTKKNHRDALTWLPDSIVATEVSGWLLYLEIKQTKKSQDMLKETSLKRSTNCIEIERGFFKYQWGTNTFIRFYR